MSCAELEIAVYMPFSQPSLNKPIEAIQSKRDRFPNPSVIGWLSSRFFCMLIVPASFVFLPGCNFVPDIRHKPQYHNPFPQLSTVAILPFRNQSEDATLSGSRVTLAYYNEMQAIPGFEVLPVGVVESQLAGFEQQVLQHSMSSPEDMQRFAKYLGVDAVLQGAITDFDAYYPPRMAIKVNWYAANEGFHPIPAGYGLPWGTKAEKKIPESIRLESERTLAREQLKTQTPIVKPTLQPDAVASPSLKSKPSESAGVVQQASHTAETIADRRIDIPLENGEWIDSTSMEPIAMESIEAIPLNSTELVKLGAIVSELPSEWPDPHGFIPPPPKSTRPVSNAQSLPIISHMRTYNGNDEDFTEQLSNYYYFRDDARIGGWESYLQRSEDFIRFCCHSHIVETLAARGGQLESRTVVRWPINRYER